MKRLLIFIGLFLFFSIAGAHATGELKRFALVVGANNGGASLVRLRYAVQDAQSMAEVLEELGAVEEEDSYLLVEPSVSEFVGAMVDLKDDIEAANEEYSRTEIFVYYSGHSDEQGLLLGPERLAYADLRDLMDTLPSSVTVTILDSCNSGMVTRLKGGTMVSPFMLDSSSSMEGYAYITSSSADEASQESDLIEGSFFTYYMVSGMRGAADANLDGKVTLNESYQYTFDETLARTEQTIGGAQHPGLDIQMNGAGDVVLTDLRLTEAGLTLDSDLEGRVFIRDEDNKLVAEVNKPSGREIELGLEPGDYTLTLEDDMDYYQGEFTVAKNRDVEVALRDLDSVSGEVTISRGYTVTTTTTTTTTTSVTINDAGEVIDSETSQEETAITDTDTNQTTVVAADEDKDDEEFIEVKVNLSKLDKILSGSLTNILNMITNKTPRFFMQSDDENLSYGYYPVNVSFAGIQTNPRNKKSINNASLALIEGKSTILIGASFSGIGYTVEEQFFGYMGAFVYNTVGKDYTSIGAQTAGIFNTVGGHLVGAQTASIFNEVEKNLIGFQSAGIFNTVESKLLGGQIAGIFNVVENNAYGFQVAGICNIVERNLIGAQIAGIFNKTEKHITGLQIGGLVNTANNNMLGVQIAGLGNQQKGDMIGLQIGGLFNQSVSLINGIQISIVNVAKIIQGGQIGLVNVATKVNGVQVGLVNISQEMTGIPIGILNITKNGYNHVAIYRDETEFYNIDLKWGNEVLYSVVGTGFNESFDRMSLNAGMGLHFPIGPFYIDLEGVWDTIFLLDEKPEFNVNLSGLNEWDESFTTGNINNIARIKLIVGIDIFKKISVFGGISYNIFIPNGSEFDPAIAPETQNVSDWVSEGYKSWPGFFVGLQF